MTRVQSSHPCWWVDWPAWRTKSVMPHKVSMTGVYNHQTDILSRNQVGSHQDYGILAPELFETRTQQFTERSILNGHLRGEHHFGFMKVDWVTALTRSEQDEPDMRIFANEYNPEKNLGDHTGRL